MPIKYLPIFLLIIIVQINATFWSDLKKAYPDRINKIDSLHILVEAGLLPDATSDQILFSIAVLKYKKNIPIANSEWAMILDNFQDIPLIRTSP